MSTRELDAGAELDLAEVDYLLRLANEHEGIRFEASCPGDIVLTGTPSGVGPIVPGDRVEVEVEGVGVLMNPVVEA